MGESYQESEYHHSVLKLVLFLADFLQAALFSSSSLMFSFSDFSNFQPDFKNFESEILPAITVGACCFWTRLSHQIGKKNDE